MALSTRDQAMEDYRITVRLVPDDPRGTGRRFHIHDTRLDNEKSAGQIGQAKHDPHGNHLGDTTAGWSAFNNMGAIYPDI